MEQGNKNQPTHSVSQTLDDDDCDSIYVVERWECAPEEDSAPPSEVLGASVTSSVIDMTPQTQSERQSNSLTQSGENSSINEQSTTSTMANSEILNGPMQSTVGTELFSMTNYSNVSSCTSSTDGHMDELIAKLPSVINENKKLQELVDAANKDLEKAKSLTDEAVNSLKREKIKGADYRTYIEKLMEEKDSIKQELETYQKTAVAAITESVAPPSTSALDSDFETLETLESQLQTKVKIIQRNEEQLQELSERLKHEIAQNEQLKEIIRKHCEMDKVKAESLSSSDEALARSFVEKEELEQKVEELEKQLKIRNEQTLLLQENLSIKERQQEEFSELRSRLEASNSSADKYVLEIQNLQEELRIKENLHKRDEETLRKQVESMNVSLAQLQSHCDELNKVLNVCRRDLEEEQGQRIIMMAAKEAEHARELDLFRMNLEETKAEKYRVECEKEAVLEELKNTIENSNTEMQNMRRTLENNSNVGSGSIAYADSTTNNHRSSSITDIPSQVYGFLKNGVLGYRDNNSSGSPSFEIIGDSAHANASAPQSVEPCPMCRKVFSSIRKLEVHAANCGMEQAARTDPFVFP